MNHLLLILMLCFSLVSCAGVGLDGQKPIQPIEVQLLTKIAATQLLELAKPNAKDLNALNTWTNRGMTVVAAIDPAHPEKLHEALIMLSQDPAIPPAYSDVTALLIIMLTTRVNIDMEANEDMSRAVALSHAALKGLQISIIQKQQSLGIEAITLSWASLQWYFTWRYA
jgi:hypothetical protein